MGDLTKNTGTALLNFAVLFAAQWFIPYVYLVIGAGGYGLFQVFSQKNKRGWLWVIPAIVLGVNAWVYDHYFRK